jgi:biopolymer transport protein ExbD
MLANKTPSRTRRMAGAGFVALALLGAGLTAWAQKPPALPALPVLAVPELAASVQPAPEQPAPTAPAQAAPPASVQPAPPAPAFAGASISVDKDGNILWEGKAVNADALKAEVKAQAASKAPTIQVSADPSTPYHEVGRIIQEAQKAGATATRFMPSGVVINTPMPPPPGSNVPRPPVPSLAIIEKPKPDPQGTPKSTAPPVNEPQFPEPRRVFIDFDNAVYLDGKVIDMAALEQAFKTAAASKTPPEVHIEPHRLSAYGKVEQVIAAANRAGITYIGVLGGV